MIRSIQKLPGIWPSSKLFLPVLLLLGVALSAGPALAVPEMELEPNNTFATRQVLPVGTTTVEGSITSFDPTVFDFSVTDALASGGVVFHSFSGTASAPFTAWIDNTVGSPNPDTILGTFDSADILVEFNDDGSPLGNGFASVVSSTVNPDGSIRLRVTGYDDFGFTGAHTQEGPYSLFVKLNPSLSPDVDFFSFSGLDPGNIFNAEISVGDFDTILGWFGDTGSLFATDDDSGVGRLSRLTGIVPASGTLNFAVSGFNDFSFVGAHSQQGTYTLSLTVVPEPASLRLLGSGLAGLGAWRRRKHGLRCPP